MNPRIAAIGLLVIFAVYGSASEPITLSDRVEVLQGIDTETTELVGKLIESNKATPDSLRSLYEKYQFAVKVATLGYRKATESEVLMGCAETDGDKAEAIASQVQGFRLLDKAIKFHQRVLDDLKKLNAKPAPPKGSREA